MLTEANKSFNPPLVDETETLPGSRGGTTQAGINIHSVRLPGLIAHQEILFGGSPGNSTPCATNTTDRSSFMPGGVLLCIRRVMPLKSLIYGMDKIL